MWHPRGAKGRGFALPATSELEVVAIAVHCRSGFGEFLW